jgi:hypothetical protein
MLEVERLNHCSWETKQEGQGDEPHPGHAGVADVLRGCFRTDDIKAAIGMLFQVEWNVECGNVETVGWKLYQLSVSQPQWTCLTIRINVSMFTELIWRGQWAKGNFNQDMAM